MSVTASEATAATPALEPATYRSVLDAAQEAVVVFDLDGRTLYRNTAYERLFGRQNGDWNEHRRHFAPAAQIVIDTELEAALRRGESWEGALDAVDGAGRPVSVWNRAGVARDTDGRALYRFWSLREHSRQHAAEEDLLRAKEAAERANQAKTRFLAAASHDLRQPLQALGMFVEVLAGRDHDAADQRIIEKIRDSVNATESLLSALLDISKLEAGLVEPSFGRFDVAQVLERLTSEFEPQAERAGLALRVVPCGLGVRSDQALLERILRNLMANALRYTETGRILLGCRRRGSVLRIEVWDTGCGIPADQLQAVFREFHQLGNPQRDRRQGLGLGLAIVERLSRLLDHPVTVRSTLGKGTCFAVEVPLAGPVPGERPVQLDLAMGTRPALIALIDDEPDVLEGVRMLLESWGHRVVTGEECCGVAEQFASRRAVPDLVIADYRLRNGTTGGQAIRQLRGRLGAEFPAIILTGDTAPERLRMAKANGHGLLHKPVQPAALRAAIDEALSRRGRPGRTGRR